MTQVLVPGHTELSLKRGATYTVFLEDKSILNGTIYSTTQSVDGLACRVTSAQSGAAVALTTPNGSTTYDLNGRSGHSVLEFRVPDNGSYLFACDYGASPAGPQVVLAVGTGVSEAIFSTVLKCLAAMFGGFGAALIVVLIVLLRRDRATKRIRQAGGMPV